MNKSNYDDCQTNHREGVCPVCGSLNVEYETFEVDDNGGSYPATCSDCGATFHEAYNFVFAGHYAIELAKSTTVYSPDMYGYIVNITFYAGGYEPDDIDEETIEIACAHELTEESISKMLDEADALCEAEEDDDGNSIPRLYDLGHNVYTMLDKFYDEHPEICTLKMPGKVHAVYNIEVGY